MTVPTEVDQGMMFNRAGFKGAAMPILDSCNAAFRWIFETSKGASSGRKPQISIRFKASVSWCDYEDTAIFHNTSSYTLQS